jgi:hypothetical protein
MKAREGFEEDMDRRMRTNGKPFGLKGGETWWPNPHAVDEVPEVPIRMNRRVESKRETFPCKTFFHEYRN